MKRMLFPIIKKYLKLLISIMLVSAMGCGIMTGLSSAYVSLETSLDNYVDDYNYPDAVITTDVTNRKKIDKLINKEYASDIYDIFACRYVIDSVNGSKEDEDIIPVLYAIRDLIAYGNPNLEVMPERIKDYVEHPKHNDYQSLHVTSIHKDHHGFVSETQLRSYFMHEIARNGNASHANTYKDRIPGVTEVPIMFEYVLDENGFCTEVKEMSREKAYEKFFGEPYDPEKDAKSRHDK